MAKNITCAHINLWLNHLKVNANTLIRLKFKVLNYKTPSPSPSILLTASLAQDHVELESIPAV